MPPIPSTSPPGRSAQAPSLDLPRAAGPPRPSRAGSGTGSAPAPVSAPLSEGAEAGALHIGLCRAVSRVVGLVFDVPAEAILRPRRGEAPVSEARQVAMYLAHVVFQLSPADLGAAFGRDRTTVAHGVRRIEERRDDAAFDARLTELEAVAEDLRTTLELAAGKSASLAGRSRRPGEASR